MSTTSDIFVVFYCWQSDTTQNHSRHLVREALDTAADRLSRDSNVPYKVQVDSDTMNEIGMCDIPATILRKLESADAVVLDLTFVAKTEKGKYCPNPNVLFELGYAFHAIGPERLVCVMNEKHGPRQEQIFDLAHRRHPVTFTSPHESRSRGQTIDALSLDLENALRPIIGLGPSGSVGGDDQRRHETDRTQIEAFWESQRKHPNTAALALAFRPVRYRERRWPDGPALVALVTTRGLWTGRHEFPPQRVGTATMEWGIYNDTYARPTWAVTYAGQVWMASALEGWQPATISERDARLSPEPPEARTIAATDWMSLVTLSGAFERPFRFAASLFAALPDGEEVEWSVSGHNLADKWLAIGPSSPPCDFLGPSRSPTLSRSARSTAAEFRARWSDHWPEYAKEMCDMFSRDGRFVTRDVLVNSARENW